ncbi:MAG: STAS domain-containing protein [Planctomycetota bacterium]|jgi:anti-anti-sigma factor
MSIQNLCEKVIVVALPKEPDISKELKTVNEIVGNGTDCDVIVDFSSVETLTSVSISNLLILHRMLEERGRRLILCNVSFLTKCIFTVAGLDRVFAFLDNRSAALAKLGSNA